MDESWTIAELAELAAEALATSGTPGPDTSATTGRPQGELDEGSGAGPLRANGRVRDLPNERLIRWYGTVGLVDPPLSRRGRVARYGRRHLLQLVAVKCRQAEREIARGDPGGADRPDRRGPSGDRPGTGSRACASEARQLMASCWRHGASRPPGPGRFWARQPQPVAGASAAGTDQDAGDGPTAGLVYGIRLAPGVTLLLDGPGREPGPEDMTRIANAARPLLKELASRGLAASATPHAAEPATPTPERDMSTDIAPIEADPAAEPDGGLGALTTSRGNLPLETVDVRAAITGLSASVEVTQGFRNPFDVPAGGDVHLPAAGPGGGHRVADGGRRACHGGRAEGTCRRPGGYDEAIAQGQRAAIAEEERPDVFTMRVGDLLPGERVTVGLTLGRRCRTTKARQRGGSPGCRAAVHPGRPARQHAGRRRCGRRHRRGT